MLNLHSGLHDGPGLDDEQRAHVIHHAWLIPAWWIIPLWPITRRLRLRRCPIRSRRRSGNGECGK